MWEDISSYNRSDNERKPNCFELKHGGLRLVIVSGHIAYRDTDVMWVLTCIPWFDVNPLKSKSADFAQREALDLVKAKIAALSLAFEGTI